MKIFHLKFKHGVRKEQSIQTWVILKNIIMAQLGVNNIIICFLLLCLGCQQKERKQLTDFSLKSAYQMHLGDTLRLYFLHGDVGNHLCMPKLYTLKMLKYIGVSFYDTLGNDVIGRTKKYSVNFLCLKKGCEIINYGHAREYEKCDSLPKNKFKKIHISIW